MITLTRRHALGSVAAVALLPACTPAAAKKAEIGAWGIDLTARDLTTKPGNDFFKYVNGTWLNATQIPSDRTSWGTFDILFDKSEQDVKAIVESTVASHPAANTPEQRIADFYSSFLNTDAINAAGLTPAQADLAAIAGAQNLEAIVRIMASPDYPVAAPFGLNVTLDAKNPDRFITGMNHGGISLPDRDYYLTSDADMVTLRNKFKDHVGRMLTLAQYSDPAGNAQKILALETQIAQRHWPFAERRDVNKTYNPKNRAEIRALAPRFPWDPMFESAELGSVTEIIVGELSAMGPLANLMIATPVDTWKAYLTYHYLHSAAAVLPAAFDNENFDFYGKTLNGVPQQRERWKRAISATNNVVGKAVGKLYVQQHFPPEAKAQMLALVQNMRRAYGERINALTWMSADTKTAAQEKLGTFDPKIGYPDTWRDYAGLDIRANDAFGNYKRSGSYGWRYDVARLGHPTDKHEWLYMDPQEINAYYNPVFNEIVFPAAILQPPFFDPNADAAVNYGGIGGVIGHEMGHGFDDQGAKSDAHGILRDWWKPADYTAFQHLTGALVTQYNGFEPLPGLHIKGDNTLGENIGDNGGLQVALYAYHLSLNGQTAPTLDTVTPEQRFFLSWAQVWREKQRDDAMRNQVMSNEHSPSAFRVNGVVRNMDAWYAAFDVQQGDALFLPDDQRIEIW